ncbi:MAG: Coenzyme F420 hydrogenase/dehydrogenase, beta subunit C-terminal domain [Sedimentibacter saalensis]|uniref:Coenzyme F420 hydrogenase/dehydrogenase, beta subunit C-terminal domain n=1 Tax=Sedimentibacter saalensis TaxID=130788 RepID=UPI002B1F0792|nr:Coenzyme F420 hydrogenase/dehydrogenase, beta subunit C-terminal domain [Sedimentibacter saalensis]MEA5093494.1 Coenzyme F420 hydrogenase/dehydrogenase, beta subunit C-terminal domain [Sedimentibacter saalensis]
MLREKSSCTGCTACASICPKRCISMKEDGEGFFYPEVDKTNCIICNQCEKVCPIDKKVATDFDTFTVCVQNKDESIKKISSAGGFIGAVFRFVFDNSGIVFGAGFDNTHQVAHMSAISMNECLNNNLFGSKYVSSDLNNSFIQIKALLNKGTMVCFVGLPCQVAGLSSYLGKNLSNLILIDLTCYGVPSRKLYRKYLTYCEKIFNDKITKVNFRDKLFGYSAPTMSVEFKSGKKRSQNSTVKSFLRCFFADLTERPSCYECTYKTVDRISDFTVGDCKSIKRYNADWDDDKGTTVVYIHSNKGKSLLKQIVGYIDFVNVPMDDILQTCGTKMIARIPYKKERDDFYGDIDVLSYEKLVNKYCPAPFDEKIANAVKGCLLVTGLNKTRLLKFLKRR